LAVEVRADDSETLAVLSAIDDPCTRQAVDAERVAVTALGGGCTSPTACYATFENGTLDLALARPISRTRYYLEMWLSAVLGAIFLSLAATLSVWLATLVVKNPGIDWGWLAIAELIELAFMFLASGIGMLFGSFMNGSRAAGGAGRAARAS